MYDAGSLLGVRLNDDEDNDGYYLKNQQGGGRGGRGGRQNHSHGHSGVMVDRLGIDFSKIVQSG